jgi:hypothetical protein
MKHVVNIKIMTYLSYICIDRTELAYMGALDGETNPALGSGKGGWGTGPNDLESTYVSF